MRYNSHVGIMCVSVVVICGVCRRTVTMAVTMPVLAVTVVFIVTHTISLVPIQRVCHSQ